jgi:hypothetical protein
MNESIDLFVVMADAIVGCGCVYERGRIVTTEQLWGYAEALIREGAVEYLIEPARVRESVVLR